MNRNKIILYIGSFLIIIAFVYLAQIILFKDPYPTDLCYRFSKSEIKYANPDVAKVLFLKGDSVYNYYIEFNIYNNLHMPISLDSVWIFDGDSVIYNLRYTHCTIEGKTDFHSSLCLQNDILYSDIYDGRNDPQEVLIAEHRFSSQTIFIKLFTSVSYKYLKPDRYYFRVLNQYPRAKLDAG